MPSLEAASTGDPNSVRAPRALLDGLLQTNRRRPLHVDLLELRRCSPGAVASLARCVRDEDLAPIRRQFQRSAALAVSLEQLEVLLTFARALGIQSTPAGRRTSLRLQAVGLRASLALEIAPSLGLAKKGALAHALVAVMEHLHVSLSGEEIRRRAAELLDASLDADARAIMEISATELLRWDTLRMHLACDSHSGGHLLHLLRANSVPQVRRVVLEHLLDQLARPPAQPQPSAAELIAALVGLSRGDAAALPADFQQLLVALVDGACRRLAHSCAPVALEVLQDLHALGRLDQLVLLIRGSASAHADAPAPVRRALIALLAHAAHSDVRVVREKALEGMCELVRTGVHDPRLHGVELAEPFVALAKLRRSCGNVAAARSLGAEALACAARCATSVGPGDLWQQMAAQAESAPLVLSALEAVGHHCRLPHDVLDHLAVWAEHADAAEHAASEAMHVAMRAACQPDAAPALRAQACELVGPLYRRGHFALCLSFLGGRQRAWERGLVQDMQPEEPVYLAAARDWLGLPPDAWLERYTVSPQYRALCLSAPVSLERAHADVQRWKAG